MFLLSKLFTFIFLPPGLFVVLILISSIFILKGKRKLSIMLLLSTATLIYLLSVEPIKDAMIKPLEDRYPFPDLQSLNCSAIVVLGGGIYDRCPDENGNPCVRPQVCKGLLMARKLWNIYRVPIIVSGGRALSHAFESQAMKEVLEGLDIPSDEIFEESNSRNTFENAFYTSKMAKLFGFKRLCLITSAYHMPRSVKYFKAFGLKIVPIPTDYRTNRNHYGWYSFFPQMSNLYGSYLAMHEYVGLLYADIKLLFFKAQA